VSTLFIQHHWREFDPKLWRKAINSGRVSFKMLLRCLYPPSPLKGILLTDMHVCKSEKAIHSICKQNLSFFVSKRVLIRREPTQVGKRRFTSKLIRKKKRNMERIIVMLFINERPKNSVEIGWPLYLPR
jgi:hypothetical protein